MVELPTAAVAPERPAVLVFSSGSVSPETLDPILWGLEEEGIPVLHQEVATGPVELTAKQAADLSPLGVGIGIEATAETAVLHHRDLPAERPLFRVGREGHRAEQLRILGMNAARLVKGEPLAFYSGPGGCRQNQDSALPAQWELEQLTQIITGIVLGLLRARAANRETG